MALLMEIRDWFANEVAAGDESLQHWVDRIDHNVLGITRTCKICEESFVSREHQDMCPECGHEVAATMREP